MAYKTNELKEIALKAVEAYKPHSIGMLINVIGISKDTFYRHFPTKSNEYKEINEAILHEKGKIKSALLNKWFKSDKPGLQIAYFRLLADSDELRALSMRHETLEVPEDFEIEVKIHNPKDDE